MSHLLEERCSLVSHRTAIPDRDECGDECDLALKLRASLSSAGVSLESHRARTRLNAVSRDDGSSSTLIELWLLLLLIPHTPAERTHVTISPSSETAMLEKTPTRREKSVELVHGTACIPDRTYGSRFVTIVQESFNKQFSFLGSPFDMSQP